MKKLIVVKDKHSAWGHRMLVDEGYVEQVKRLCKIPSDPVEGIDVSTEVWYNNNGVLGVIHYIIDGKLMEGDIGPEVGVMSAVVWEGSTSSKLYEEGIGKLVPALRKIGFIGQCALSTTVSEDKLRGNDIVATVNTETMHIVIEMCGGNGTSIINGLHDSTLSKLSLLSKFGIGVRLCIPPFPYDLLEDIKVVVKGFNKYNMKHIWTRNIHNEKGKYEYEGNDGELGLVTARGDAVDNWCPIRDARRRAMRTIKNLKVEGLMYRRDAGEKARKSYQQLTKWGWL